MTALAFTAMSVRRAASAFGWRMKDRFQKLGRAWRYLTNTMTEDDAYSIMEETYDLVGSYPLEEISAGAVLKAALRRWEDHPDLRRLSEEATARVYSKWDSDGHLRGAAEDWALNLVEEYAESSGITLIERDEFEDDEDGEYEA